MTPGYYTTRTVEAKTRTLIIEPDPALTEVMVELLDREGQDVTVVGGLDAMSRVRPEDIDLVILDADAVMIHGDTNTLSKLQRWMRSCATPPSFVVVSVHPSPARQFHQLSSQMVPSAGSQGVTWLRKPFRNEDFLCSARQVQDRNSGDGSGMSRGLLDQRRRI